MTDTLTTYNADKSGNRRSKRKPEERVCAIKAESPRRSDARCRDAQEDQRDHSDEHGSIVDLVETNQSRGQTGTGTVHHVAYKAEDTAEREQWRDHLAAQNLNVTEIIDRKYFKSIYFREPGGVLFEIATMGPGFTVDQSEDEVGTELALPDWLENERKEIESRLPSFERPSVEPALDDG